MILKHESKNVSFISIQRRTDIFFDLSYAEE